MIDLMFVIICNALGFLIGCLLAVFTRPYQNNGTTECFNCEGRGYIVDKCDCHTCVKCGNEETCQLCNGTGYVPKNR